MWIVETTKGWNGKINADAAISNFGLSLLTAVERHCKEPAYILISHVTIKNTITLQGNYKSITSYFQK